MVVAKVGGIIELSTSEYIRSHSVQTSFAVRSFLVCFLFIVDIKRTKINVRFLSFSSGSKVHGSEAQASTRADSRTARIQFSKT